MNGGSIIETWYLIDYENTGGEGLSGCAALGQSDHIVIFFTNNARRVDMSLIARHGSASLEMEEVPDGRQSADLHICSYLGYLVGSRGKNQAIVIVSKDTDFDKLISFWVKRTGMQISRRQTIGREPQPAPRKKPPTTGSVPEPALQSVDKNTLNVAVMRALGSAGLDYKKVGAVASVVASHYGEAQLLTAVQRDLMQLYPDYQAICSVLQAVFSDLAGTGAHSGLIPALRRAGLGGQDETRIRSLLGAQNAKQKVYQYLTAEYGQQQGLALYHQIRDEVTKAQRNQH